MDLSNVDNINSEEGLLSAISQDNGTSNKGVEGITPPEGGKLENGLPPEGGDTGLNPDGTPKAPITGDGDGDGTAGEGEGEIKLGPDGKPIEQEQEFSNMVAYMDNKFDLGLNLEALPKDLSREKEAEIISELFDKVTKNTEQEINKFSEVQELLKDPEVEAFINAKRNGATLRDIMKAASTSVDTMDDASIITQKLKTEYPNMEAEEIEQLVQGYKDKGVLEKMATSAREQAHAYEQKQDELREAKEANDYKEGVQHLASMLDNTQAVYDVPLTPDMKKTVFTAATQRDKAGMTYLDKALQSDEGVILATLGVLYMEDLMKAKASTDTNRRNKSLVEKLFENPSNLQSGEQDITNTPTFNPEVANSF